MGDAAPRTGLVLSGGGARGAYQAGALVGLKEILGPKLPFEVMVGTSAGALNVGMLGAYADAWSTGVDALSALWTGISASDVFRTDLRSLSGTGARWIKDLSFGGLTRKTAPKSLLDNAPQRKLLERHVPFDRLHANIDAGVLRALVVSAVELGSANGVAFVEAGPDVDLWERPRWEIRRTRLGVSHLLASSAIPVFFPSVRIDDQWFGDGSVRNTHPMSPAIHLGMDRIVTIGVRSLVREHRNTPRVVNSGRDVAPSIADIAGVLLDAVMLDAVELDVAQAERVNASVVACPSQDPAYPYRLVDVLWITPSQRLADIAGELADRIPAGVRYLLRGLGDDASTTELASFLLFDAVYCSRLVALGRQDVLDRAGVVRQFFDKPPTGRVAGAARGRRD